MKIPACIVFVIAGLVLVSGCVSDPGIQCRYSLEKEIWRAKMIEVRIWSQPLTISQRNVDAGIRAYEAILAKDLVKSGNADSWGSTTRMDYRRLIVTCEMALARLFFIRLQDNAGVTYFRSGLRRHDLMFNQYRGTGRSRVRELYKSIESDRFETKCAGIVESVVEEGIVWYGDVAIGDTLLSLPVYLVRTSIDRSGSKPDSGYVELADRLYSRIIRTWPDSLVAQKARLARADVRVLEGRYEDAIKDIDAVLEVGSFDMHADEILLFRSEILAHGLNRYEEALTVFDSLIANDPESRLARTATLDKASVLLKTGSDEEGVSLLRDLELNRDVPPETATMAMFIRAMYLKKHDHWGEAQHLLWRICRLYPFTRASFVAPLEILSETIRDGDQEQAWRTHSKVEKFYLTAVSKNSASVRYRHLLDDFLMESYIMMDAVREGARMLETEAEKRRGEKRTIGYFKSALVYLNLLNDRENGVRMLKKCLDDSPRSRYSTEVQGQLDTVSSQEVSQ